MSLEKLGASRSSKAGNGRSFGISLALCLRVASCSRWLGVWCILVCPMHSRCQVFCRLVLRLLLGLLRYLRVWIIFHDIGISIFSQAQGDGEEILYGI